MKDARGHVTSLDGSNITFGYPNMINSQNLMSSKQVRLKSCCNFLYLCVFLSSYALKNSNISYRCNWIRIILTWEIRSESIACDRLCSIDMDDRCEIFFMQEKRSPPLQSSS